MIDGDEVSARMDELDELDRPGLRVAWRQAFGNAPPHFLSMLFMRKALIWDMQCKIYGNYIQKCHLLLPCEGIYYTKVPRERGNKMAQKAPGKSHREGISLTKLIKMFPCDEAARNWIEGVVWPDGPFCPHCGSVSVQTGIRHKSMTHRCRDCAGKPRFRALLHGSGVKC